jgi:hypothetical protein
MTQSKNIIEYRKEQAMKSCPKIIASLFLTLALCASAIAQSRPEFHRPGTSSLPDN